MAEKLGLLILAVLVFIASLCLFSGKREPDYRRLADSIRLAEGNQNYGLEARWEAIGYRKKCIMVCKRYYEQWASKGKPGGYLEYLSKRYCPLNHRIWLSNVRYYYEGRGSAR